MKAHVCNHNNGTRFVAFFSCVIMPERGHGGQTDKIDPPSILTRACMYIYSIRRASLCKTSMFAVTIFQFGSSIMANVKNIAFNNAKRIEEDAARPIGPLRSKGILINEVSHP